MVNQNMISGKLFKNITLCSVVMLIIAAAFIGIGCVDNEDTTTEDVTTEDVAEEATVSGEISVTGSTTVLPLSTLEAEAFMDEYPDAIITVKGGGSGVGIAALLDGTTEIAQASRSIKDSEVEEAQSNGINPVEHAIAWDGIAVVVNPENPVTEITFEDLKGIYTGTITNWAELGGEDAEISVVGRDSSSGTYEYFKEEVLGDDVEFTENALALSDNGLVKESVVGNTQAIGYIGYAYLDENVKALALDAAGDGTLVEATPEMITSGEYPLARQLYYYTNGEPTGLAKEYIDYVFSATGQDVVSESGYFPVN
jgi:phosphate transport system substrate-binding protein